MSGHSKWSTIRRQKEINDAKKGKAFTKVAGAITIAVRQGGGIADPNQNFRLRLAIEKARQFNMPKENIQRAIDKGLGTGTNNTLSEVVFEGFGPGGVAVLIETLTDNKLRIGQQIRTLFDKAGGSMGGSGAVGYLFRQIGELRVEKKPEVQKSIQDQELEIIDMGVQEIEEDEHTWLVFCDKNRTYATKQALEEAGYVVESAELVMQPQTLVSLSEEHRQKTDNLVEAIENLDDVHAVWVNYA